MAGRAQETKSQELARHLNDPRGHPRDPVRETAAKLYGQGDERKHIARMLLDHLVPNGKERPEEQRLSQARTKLRNWEQSQAFRDMIYNLAVVKLDLQTPAILGGIAKKAKRGRVDAARLALEVTGRHNPKGEAAPTQIIVAIEGVPRPHVVRSSDTAPDEIDGDDALVAEDEDV